MKRQNRPFEVVVLRKRRRFRRFEPPLPDIIGRVSGARLSDPDYHRERREIEEAAAEEASKPL